MATMMSCNGRLTALISVAWIVLLQAIALPQGFRTLSVQKLGFVDPGYFLIAPDAYDSLGFLDHSGVTIRRRSSGVISTLQSYGDSVITHFLAVGSTTQFLRRNRMLDATDTLRLSGGYPIDFHEGKMWSDTTYMVLGHDDRIVDLSGSVQGGRKDAIVRGAIIQERSLKTGDVLFEWKSLDHIPTTDATDDIDLTQSRIDYIHVNSITADPSGNIILSCRHLDEVICISRTSGSVLWRLGGEKSRGNQFTFTNDTAQSFSGFSHQHTAFYTTRGTLMLFDNGNLKPEPRSSRVVEYTLDTTRRTATRVWEYIPSPRVFSASMGSASELENGNVLIGYGLVNQPVGSPLVAHEVNRRSQVVAEISDASGTPLASYRVLKTRMGMCGLYRKVSSAGIVTFASADSTTHVSMNLKRVTFSTGVVVERHSYAPRLITFVGAPHCGTLPMRWVVRVEDTSAVRGELIFDLGSMSSVEDPEKIRLLYRPNEGQEGFMPLEGAYVADRKAIVLPVILTGEFMLAYKDCFDPIPVTPLNSAVEVSTSPKLVWKVAALADAYDVEFSTDASFTTPQRFTTRRTDTTLSSLVHAQTYHWRVRKRYSNSVGPWSSVFSFTTQIGLCALISPVLSGKDTMAILPGQTFRWTRGSGSNQSRLTISEAELGIPVVDVTTMADTFSVGNRLEPNTRYTWTVRGVKGTITGRPAAAAFIITAPSQPVLTSPQPEAMLPYAQSTLFSWEPVLGAVRYGLVIRSARDSSVLYRDTTIRSPWVRVNSLPKNHPMVWECRAIGRYGSGLVSEPRAFTLVFDSPLQRPILINPRGNEHPFGADSIAFAWTTVQDATLYRLQVFDQRRATSALIDSTLSTSAVGLTGYSPSTSYYWRVMAINDRTVSPWSDTARFITAEERTNLGLLPLRPTTDAEDVPTTGQLQFSTSDTYREYEVELSRNPDFRVLDTALTTLSGTAWYNGLLERTRYFWRAIGIDVQQQRTTGPASSFITQRATVDVPDQHSQSRISIRQVGQDLEIIGLPSDAMTCSIYDVLGQHIVTATSTDRDACRIQKPLTNGVVVVVITTPQNVLLWKGATLLR